MMERAKTAKAADRPTPDFTVAESDKGLLVTFNIGGYPSPARAQIDAQQFMRPLATQQRSTIFPDPRNYKLQVVARSAEVKVWGVSLSPNNRMYIALTMEVCGDRESAYMWVNGVAAKIRVLGPSAYARTNEREQHTREAGLPTAAPGRLAAPRRRLVAESEREAHFADRAKAKKSTPKQG